MKNVIRWKGLLELCTNIVAKSSITRKDAIILLQSSSKIYHKDKWFSYLQYILNSLTLRESEKKQKDINF